MIKSVNVINPLGESLLIELDNPESSGFIIKSISGLGPVKRTINTTEYSTIDGGVFNSARLPYRNIVLDLIFFSNSSIEEVRLKSYSFFQIKQQITLEITTDNRHVMATGYVESNQPDIFSKQEGAQVSIICPDPYFYGTESLSYSFSSIKPNFEFPFSFEMAEGVPEQKIISYISLESVGNIAYDGANDTGVIIYIHALHDVEGDLTIMNLYTGEYMILSGEKLAALTGSGILAGDSIYISTVAGNKYVQLMREGAIYNILNILDRDSAWLSLRQGDNFFQFFWNGEPGELQFYMLGNTLYEGI